MPQHQPEVVNAFNKPIKSLSPEQEGFRAFPITEAEKLGVELPGCTAIEEVRLGRHTLPNMIEHSVPIDTTDRNFKDIHLPTYVLDESNSGTPVLLRSLSSNDGHWQAGQTLYVKGTWADENPKGAKVKGS
jgi:hypothetical protein